MRKMLLGLGALPLLALGMGCHHVGGECDCAAVPGDSVNHNPHVTYHAGSPVVTSPAVSHTANSPAVTVLPPAGTTGSFEAIAAPKKMPPK